MKVSLNATNCISSQGRLFGEGEGGNMGWVRNESDEKLEYPPK